MRNNKMNEDINKDIPCVTIITPSFNQGKYIKETIESVLNQDYPNLEYWVIDGGSTDDTIDILKSYGDRIHWISEKDDGQADAVNKGILRAKGSIIGWLNSDDTYLAGAISHVVGIMKLYPDTDMVYGEGYFIDIDSNVIDRYSTEEFNKKRLAETCMICQPTAFFTKDIISKVGMLDEKLDLCMDYELWMKIADVGNVRYTARYLASSRMYTENKTLSRRKEVHKEVCDTIFRYYGYVPFIWIFGYVMQLNQDKCNIRLFLLLLRYNLTFNIKYIYLTVCEIKRLIINKKRIKQNFTGIYEDDWVSERYEAKLKANKPCNTVILTGNHIWPIKEHLVIQIRIDGFVIEDVIIKELGEFRREIFTEHEISSGTHKVELLMKPIYCPNDYKINLDERKLSFKLYDINFDM